jgi:hypothetical protein
MTVIAMAAIAEKGPVAMAGLFILLTQVCYYAVSIY